MEAMRVKKERRGHRRAKQWATRAGGGKEREGRVGRGKGRLRFTQTGNTEKERGLREKLRN